MNTTFDIPFSGRAHSYTESEVEVVVDVMRHAKSLTQGTHLREFEYKFIEYTGAVHAFAVSNATSALEIAAQLCRLKEGDEVIVPAHTFTSSAYPFLKTGATIIWADIDLETRVVTPSTLEPHISSRTRVVVVPHLYGYGADVPGIKELTDRYGLLIVEDAAQAFGVDIEEKSVGTFGDFGVFSFHAHKNISTLGEGGMLVVKDEQYAKLVPMLRHNGHCQFDGTRQDYWIPAMGNVDMPTIQGTELWPNNYCIGEASCALGVHLIDRIDDINLGKRQRAIKFIDGLKDCVELEFHRVDSRRHNYHLLVARIRNGWRDLFIRRMAANHSIQCVVQYYPLYNYPFYNLQKNILIFYFLL